MDGNAFVQVEYLQFDLRINHDDSIGGPRIDQRGCGQGCARMTLRQVPAWLADRPGTLIVAIRPV